MRKGMALITTLLMLTFITMAVTMLWITTRDEILISGNMRRATISKHAAASGINHFIALKIKYEALREMSEGRQEFVIIQKQRIPDTQMFYRVKVSFCCDQSGGDLPDTVFKVVSDGQYGRDEKILALHTLSATMQTRALHRASGIVLAPIPQRP